MLLALAAVAAAALLLRGEETSITVEPNWVGIIDPKSNRVVDQVPAGIRPGPLAAGGGSVYAANLDGKSLTRIDPDSTKVVDTIPLDATPNGVAFGHGHVWVVHGLTGQVTRIDPALGGVKTFTDVAATRIRSPVAAVASGSEYVWAVFGDSTLARLEPKAEQVEQTFAGARPTAVVEGGDMVWVVSSASDSTVYRFNPDTFRTGPIGRNTNVGRRSTGIAYGHGAGWVASSGDDFVTRIDAGTNSAVQIPVGAEPVAVAVGAGSVWVANAGDGTVSRIDPATRKVVKNDRGREPAFRNRRRRRARLGDGAGTLNS